MSDSSVASGRPCTNTFFILSLYSRSSTLRSSFSMLSCNVGFLAAWHHNGNMAVSLHFISQTSCVRVSNLFLIVPWMSRFLLICSHQPWWGSGPGLASIALTASRVGWTGRDRHDTSSALRNRWPTVGHVPSLCGVPTVGIIALMWAASLTLSVLHDFAPAFQDDAPRQTILQANPLPPLIY